MLPAKDELSHYAETVAKANPALVPPVYAARIAETIKAMSPGEAEAWMALLKAAEHMGGEYDYSRTDEDAE